MFPFVILRDLEERGVCRNEAVSVAVGKLEMIQGSKHFIIYLFFFRSEGIPQVILVHLSDFNLKVFAAAIITNNDNDSFTAFNF